MLNVSVKSKCKIELGNIYKYIKENTPKEIKKEHIDDVFDDNGELIKRIYTCVSKSGVEDEFIMEMENGELYLTHNSKINNIDDEPIDLNDILN